MRGETPWTTAPQDDLSGLVVVVFTLGMAFGILLGGLATMGGKRDRHLKDKAIAGKHPYVRIAMAAVATVKNGVWDDLPMDWQTKILVAVVDAETDGPATEAAGRMTQAAKDEYRSLIRVRHLTCSSDEDD